MTEAEWLNATDPFTLTKLDRARWSDRKLRLFCCACCHRYTTAFDDRSTAAAAELLERYADGLIGESERLRPNTFSHNSLICDMWGGDAYRSALRAADRIAGDFGYQFNHGPKRERAVQSELEAQSALFRDIFGNPFRPVAFSPDWRTDTAVALAKQMYDSRDFGAMPILADALQDAGCDSDDILSHCRDPKQVHVRGCWVVDLILGKS
jgi:hypothetical protein